MNKTKFKPDQMSRGEEFVEYACHLNSNID